MSDVSGEWVEPTGAAPLTLIYLHGGGYYSCSPETHRPVTAGCVSDAAGFRIIAMLFLSASRMSSNRPLR